MTYHIGVTGTRYGATHRQLHEALQIVRAAVDEHRTVTVHEGCCDGFDDQFTELLSAEQGVAICGHPPIEKRWSRNDHQHLHTYTQDELAYIPRNFRIVRHGKNLVIAVPKGRKPVHRGSGTWQCLATALRHQRETQVIYPDGTKAPGTKAFERTT